ncbi:MAG: serine/threonine-protein kinase [Actinoallomurus sp.]
MDEPLRTGDPQCVGAYRIARLLGEGGQGAVYRGEGADGEVVAVKLLHARFSGDAKARARFAAELAHAGRVAPFCTARVLDADLEGDRPYIVSEYVDGPSLSELIATGHSPQGPALERLAIATVTALAAIHEAGIVHRDFKPSNVIMGTDGARVIDFGIARALESTGTLSSAIVGTPAYMAPEQIGGGRVGPAADIFAWGCTIVYAANGTTPFGQDSIPAVMHRILHEQPDLDGISGPLRDIAAACLTKDAAGRPADPAAAARRHRLRRRVGDAAQRRHARVRLPADAARHGTVRRAITRRRISGRGAAGADAPGARTVRGAHRPAVHRPAVHRPGDRAVAAGATALARRGPPSAEIRPRGGTRDGGRRRRPRRDDLPALGEGRRGAGIAHRHRRRRRQRRPHHLGRPHPHRGRDRAEPRHHP